MEAEKKWGSPARAGILREKLGEIDARISSLTESIRELRDPLSADLIERLNNLLTAKADILGSAPGSDLERRLFNRVLRQKIVRHMQLFVARLNAGDTREPMQRLLRNLGLAIRLYNDPPIGPRPDHPILESDWPAVIPFYK